MKVVEMFSGIGSQKKALERVFGDQFSVSNTCEWDINAIIAYDIIHNGFSINEKVELMSEDELNISLKKYTLSYDGKKPFEHESLKKFSYQFKKILLSSIIKTNNFVSITDVSGGAIDSDVDLLTYSFPCQDLSTAGSLHGFNKGISRGAKTRSGMLWEVERILLEMNKVGKRTPRFLLMENVLNILSERHRDDFNEWIKTLEDMGYYNSIYRLNSVDCGIPQTRKRAFMLSVFIGDLSEEKKAELRGFIDQNKVDDYAYLNTFFKDKKISLLDILKTNYDNHMYKKEADIAALNCTPSRLRIIMENPKVVDENGNTLLNVRTLTTKQDRNPNSGNIYYKNELENKTDFRFLTPRECLLLMGFSESDYEALINNNFQHKTGKTNSFFTKEKIYKFAGNSIVVNALEVIFELVKRTNDKFFQDEIYYNFVKTTELNQIEEK